MASLVCGVLSELGRGGCLGLFVEDRVFAGVGDLLAVALTLAAPVGIAARQPRPEVVQESGYCGMQASEAPSARYA